MRTIVLTGGIATGKTTALNYLKTLSDRLVFFDCDAAVSRLLDSGAIASSLTGLFGPDAVTSEKKANRPFLRNLIFHDSTSRKGLESLIHPEITQECLALQKDTVKNGRAAGFVIDIPLFYEGEFDFGQDLVVLTSVSSETQKQRLALRDGFDSQMIDSILQAQLPLEEKEKKADVILWNEGPESWLQKQIDLLYHHYFL